MTYLTPINNRIKKYKYTTLQYSNRSIIIYILLCMYIVNTSAYNSVLTTPKHFEKHIKNTRFPFAISFLILLLGSPLKDSLHLFTMKTYCVSRFWTRDFRTYLRIHTRITPSTVSRWDLSLCENFVCKQQLNSTSSYWSAIPRPPLR